MIVTPREGFAVFPGILDDIAIVASDNGFPAALHPLHEAAFRINHMPSGIGFPEEIRGNRGKVRQPVQSLFRCVALRLQFFESAGNGLVRRPEDQQDFREQHQDSGHQGEILDLSQSGSPAIRNSFPEC